ncbi:beta-lactamase domain-containing protein [Methanolacinia petrolearia DSM 11571]|uniref:Beta-lactamase domain-containing protein n=1 Tax=Methanolacinia petrolearia (strain DSM 11571 / OCM 486 / SEBR 4847) TaxID=679926 RepID=E1RGY4_METP4|nr:MBL fold metallo-hydrolase [Methanolacinia petrolearia]ADN37513.1 beta-lactamase domain-containing protein [Methanolacinia petrolearia DSM 11571]
MNRFSFVAHIPDTRQSLQTASQIIFENKGNINRIHYDRQIDPHTAFIEVTCTCEDYQAIREKMISGGFLRTSIRSLPFLKFKVKVPHKSGSLLEFLKITSGSEAGITSIDFDDTGSMPDIVSVSLILNDTGKAEELMNVLREAYPIEILEYDITGESLDRTIFYVRFAQQIRKYLEDDKDEELLMDFLKDINHTVQELTHLGNDPEEVFDNYLRCGEYLQSTTGNGFYADVQEIRLSDSLTLFCFQLPGGGSIFLFENPDEIVMIDTGYGIYAKDARKLFEYYGLDIDGKLKYIVTTHGDADHCGAGGTYEVPAYMHPVTLEIIRRGNRAWGSKSENSILERVYTTMIALFSRWNPPREENIRLFPGSSDEFRSIFPIIGRMNIAGVDFEVLISEGGHQSGQLILFSPDKGLLFTADSLMNFHSFSKDRRTYNSIADFLVTSVNVDSDLARNERKALLEMASEFEKETGMKCLVCGGHGTISVLNEEGKLETYEEPEHYTHNLVQ